jgi:hypothetical protein
MTTGRCSAGAAGRPKITPVVAQFAFQIDKARIQPKVFINDKPVKYKSMVPRKYSSFPESHHSAPEATFNSTSDVLVEVPLITLAAARSGDKGNNANVGVIARKPDYLPWIKQSATEKTVKKYFGHVVEGDVMRFDLPGMNAVNFLLTNCLGGGGTTTLHLDNLAKTYAQQLLALPIKVPSDLIENQS